jgi:hypothetical protein
MTLRTNQASADLVVHHNFEIDNAGAGGTWWRFDSAGATQFNVYNNQASTSTMAFLNQGAGSFNLDAEGSYVDYAEMIRTRTELQPGDIVIADSNKETASLTSQPNDPKLIGILSTKPGVLLNTLGQDSTMVVTSIGSKGKELYSANAAPLALAGRVPAKIITHGETINSGDPVTSSTIAGFGMKSTQPGAIIGKAIETYDPTKLTCTSVNSVADIVWPEDDGTNIAKPCFQLPDGTYLGKTMVYVNISWFDTDIYLNATGDISLSPNVSSSTYSTIGYADAEAQIASASYLLLDTAQNPVTRIAQFARIAVAKINTGILTAKNIISDTVIANLTKSKQIQTTTISPLSDISDTITMDGNVDVQGTLTATDIQSTSVTADSVTAREATVTTLYADNIISKNGSITDLMVDKITALRTELKNLISTTAPVATDSALMAEVPTWSTTVATDSASINGNLAITGDLQIGARLTLMGDAQMGNAFITGTFTAGEIAIKDNFIETTNTALYIQPSQVGSVHILGDTLIIADTGDVVINANVTINGSLLANLINASEATISGSLTVGPNRDTLATPSANLALNVNGALATDKINIATAPATLIASGSLISQMATTSSELASNATAGTATLPAGKTEVIIHNDKITTGSMVYLTPAGSTSNQVVYLKSKFISPTPEASASAEATPSSSFTFGVDSPLTSDVNVNWWIIN